MYSLLILTILLSIFTISTETCDSTAINSISSVIDRFYLAIGNKDVVIYCFCLETNHFVHMQEQFFKHGQEISVINGVNPYSQNLLTKDEAHNSIIFVYPMNISNLETFMESVSQNSSEQWKDYIVVIWPDISSLNIEETLQNFNFPLNSSLYFAFESHKSNVDLWDYYNIGNQTFFQSIKMDSGLIDLDSLESQKLRRRSNFKDLTLKVAAVDDEFYENEVKFKVKTGNDTDESPEFAGGIAVEILNCLAESYNFSYEAFAADLGTASNNKTDIDYLVANGIVDLSVSLLRLTVARKREFTFLHPAYFERLEVFFKIPPANMVRDIYVSSFKWSLWLALLITWAVLVATINIIAWTKEHILNESNQLDSEIAESSIIWGFGAVSQQGWHIQPESSSLRIIFLVGYLLGLVCFVGFSAAIVSKLSLKFHAIKELNDLKANSYSYIAELENVGWELTESILKKSFGVELTKENFQTEPEAMRSLANIEKSAYLTTLGEFTVSSKMANVSERTQCEEFEHIPISKETLYYGMMLPLDSPFVNFFNWKIIRLIEFGLMHRYIKVFQRASLTQCLDSAQHEGQNGMGVLDVFTAYIIISSGFVLSLGILIVEMIVHRKMKEKMFSKILNFPIQF